MQLQKRFSLTERAHSAKIVTDKEGFVKSYQW